MTFNPWTFFLEVVNFVALAYVLRRLLYRPLSEAIERRRADVRRRQAEAEKARDEAEAIKKDLEEKLADLERQRLETVSQARQQAEAERKKSWMKRRRRRGAVRKRRVARSIGTAKRCCKISPVKSSRRAWISRGACCGRRRTQPCRRSWRTICSKPSTAFRRTSANRCAATGGPKTPPG